MVREMGCAIIREVILENFMSHEYSRIPLTPGLNVICGPNGAGKSSILLGIAVALGQSYTERSKRLGDLIMRGKKLARVSLVFDNRAENGKRPIPEINSDTIVLSRYLSKDGTYWYQINNRTVTKGDVLRLLGRLSIDPDNMLIIMHQNMIDVFGATDASEKLRMVEEAVGIQSYREKIMEAQQKLSHTLSEEESVRVMLQKAQETLRYWEGEYERLKRKRELERRKKQLELEYAWSKVVRQEKAVADLERQIENMKNELEGVREELKKWDKKQHEVNDKLRELDSQVDGLYRRLVEIGRWEARHQTRLELLERVQKIAELKENMHFLKEEAEKAKKEMAEVEGLLSKAKRKREEIQKSLIEASAKSAVLEFRQGLLEHELSDLRRELRRARRELEETTEEAQKIGRRVETARKPQEVLDELRLVNAQLGTLADVPADAEHMYLSYKSTLRELEKKAREVERNRQRALEELELRKQRWREEMERLISEINKEYRRFLERVGGTGEISLVNAEDIESAGLELTVGFKGITPQILDAYTQSGGERTTALMCFLLALQRRIKSPVRAIDEFEAHLDPRNRENLFQSVAEVANSDTAQYLVITPGRLAGIEKAFNVIVVQSVGGVSKVGVVT